MFPKIISVKVADDYVLFVTFDNHEVKKVDLSLKLSNPRFEALKNKVLFRNVEVDQGGYGISWNDDIDMSEYELWIEGESLN